MSEISLSQKESQCNQILAFMKDRGTITPLEALEHIGCFRLSARIYDLRKRGWLIKTDSLERNGKSFARYSLKGFETDDIQVG